MILGNIINGSAIAEEILKGLEAEVEFIKNNKALTLKLAIILVGNNPASTIYVQNKIKAANRISIDTALLQLSNNITQNELIAKINNLNQDPTISGIIIQLPLPDNINKAEILSVIDPYKDVDGFHPLNVGYLHNGLDQGFIPPTSLACLEVIKKYEKNLSGKDAVIIGRSNIVGKPLATLLMQKDCTVTICHSKTRNLISITSKADIVIAAMGVPLKLTQEYFSSKAIVIDVGISRLANNKIVGDVDFKNVVDKVRYITPVPGGIGPLTIAFLLKNTLKTAKLKIN